MSTNSARYMLAALAALTALFLTPPASAQDDGCESLDGGRMACSEKRYRVYLKHSRAYELLCSEAVFGAGTPDRIKALCEEAEDVHRIWVQAQHTDKAQRKAREAQRASNLAKGSLKECRTARKVAERQRGEQRRRAVRWKVVSYIAGGVAVVLGGAVVGDWVGLWDL